MNTSCLQIIAIACALAIAPAHALGAAPLTHGAVIRVASDSIEAGWHTGRTVLDARKCWMVKLDKPSSGGYTMLALSFVKSAESARADGWSPLPLQSIIKAQPVECLEQGSD
jgi:hypothetical protein